MIGSAGLFAIFIVPVPLRLRVAIPSSLTCVCGVECCFVVLLTAVVVLAANEVACRFVPSPLVCSKVFLCTYEDTKILQ
jgi:hypothetical protein